MTEGEGTRGEWIEQMMERTKQFALAIIRLHAEVPRNVAAQVLGRQMINAGTSPGAHYREAQHARSAAEFVSKIDGGTQELRECAYWLELLRDACFLRPSSVDPWLSECKELTAIFVSMSKHAGGRHARR